MKLGKVILALLVLGLICGIAYLTVADVPVERATITKVIPNDRFFGSDS